MVIVVEMASGIVGRGRGRRHGEVPIRVFGDIVRVIA